MNGALARAFEFTVGTLPAGGSVITDAVDLGEEHGYTLLIACKSGVASIHESMEIQNSIDGVLWSSAVEDYQNENVAWYMPPNGSDYFTVHCRPIGRFVRIFFRNGNVGQTNLVIKLIAMTGI